LHQDGLTNHFVNKFVDNIKTSLRLERCGVMGWTWPIVGNGPVTNFHERGNGHSEYIVIGHLLAGKKIIYLLLIATKSSRRKGTLYLLYCCGWKL